jgi:arabinose-5-phosphate isomerase
VKDLYVLNTKPAVLPDAGLKQIIVEITKNRLGATAVITQEGKISGIITDGDLRRMLESSNKLENIKANDILTRNAKTILADDLAVNALEVLRNNDISQLLVTDRDSNYLGILHLHDLVKEGIV